MMTLRTILFASDGSPIADAARVHADALAERHGATLHVLRVELVPPASDFHSKAPADARGLGIVEAVRFAPSPDTAIVDYADEIGADIVVLGTHGRTGWQRWSLGSTAEGVLRRSPCPVLTVGPEAEDRGGPVLAPLAFESSSDAALEAAMAVAQSRGVGVVALHVIEPVVIPAPYAVAFDPLTQPEVRDRAHEALARWVESVGDAVPVTIDVRGERAAAAIVEAAREHDASVIVQASHGRRGFSRWLLGSVAELVVRQAPCPVLTLRAEARPPWSVRDGLAAVPRADWPALFDALSAVVADGPHAVTIEIVSPDAGGTLYRDVPLLGLTFDPHDDAVEVLVASGGHHVVRPFAVRADGGPWEADALALGAGPGPHTIEVVRADGTRERLTIGALAPA
ncbi:universal stress protein [Rubrivirga sp. IMCC43871]|uniref:universal stress protein n=1 Tax=Rubrivirga sp. IMCC43871 TaxID=3391575 RepID=UPI00398FAFE1